MGPRNRLVMLTPLSTPPASRATALMQADSMERYLPQPRRQASLPQASRGGTALNATGGMAPPLNSVVAVSACRHNKTLAGLCGRFGSDTTVPDVYT